MSDEIKKLVEDVNKAATEIKTQLSEVKGDASKQGAEWNQKFDKIVKDMTDGSEAIQVRMKAQEEKAAALEAALARADAAGQKKTEDEIVTKSKAAFDSFVRKGDLPGDFKMKDGALEIRAMATTSNPDGGYLVLPEMADFIATRAFETSPLRRLARVAQISSNALEVIVRDVRSTTAWTAEGSAAAGSDHATYGKLRIDVHKCDTRPIATIEMLDDAAFNVEQWLMEDAARDLSAKENTGYVSGSGIAQPKGLLSYDAWASAGVYERGKVEQVNLGGASALTADGLIGLQAALPEMYQGNANWLVKRATYGAILKLKGNDNYFFSPTLLKDGQLQLQLLGRPLNFADDMPAVAANALSVAYGDFSVGYTIVDKVGLNVIRDPYTSKGFVEFYTYKRSGGAVTAFDAIKIGKVAA